MKICCISDTHGQYRSLELPEADAIVHAGDITRQGSFDEVINFFMWYGALDQYKYKIVIAGNHDWAFQTHPKEIEKVVPENVDYLFDSEVIYEGIKFYGSPWQPIFLNWAFNISELEREKKWKLIPEDTDVLITHTPPHGHGDMCINGDEAGCKPLLSRIHEVRPKVSISGHIHESRGVIEDGFGLKYVNCSVLNRSYRLVNDPIVIEVNNEDNN